MFSYLLIYFKGGQARPESARCRWPGGDRGGVKSMSMSDWDSCDNMPFLRPQSSEGNFTMSREIRPVRRSFCRHGSCTFTEVARLVHSGNVWRVLGVALSYACVRVFPTSDISSL